MSYQTIDDIATTASTVTGSDKIEVRQSSTTKKSSLSTLLTYIQGTISFPSQTLAESAPSRVIGTVFQPNTTKVVNGQYAVSVSCQSLLLGNASGKIELLSDSANPPTTVRDTVANAISGVLSLVNSNTQALRYKVPAGHYVLLKSTVIGGTATFSIVSQSEVTEG